MNTIQKIIGLSIAVLLTISIATAQRSGKTKEVKDPIAHAQKQTEKMTEHLSLTKEQQKKVSKINLEYAKKIKAAKEEGKDHDVVKSLKSEKKSAIKTVLTPDQVTKLEAKKSRKGRGKRKSCSHHGGERASSKGEKGHSYKDKDPETREKEKTARMTEKLSLTTAQATQLTEINLAYGQKKSALRNSGDKETTKAAMQTLRTDQTNAIKAILTPKQVTTFDEMIKNRGGKGRKDSCR